MNKIAIIVAITVVILIIIIVATIWYIMRRRDTVLLDPAAFAVPAASEILEEIALFASARAPLLFVPHGYFNVNYGTTNIASVLLFRNKNAKNAQIFVGVAINGEQEPVVAVINAANRGYLIEGRKRNANGSLIPIGPSTAFNADGTSDGTPIILATFAEASIPAKTILRSLLLDINFNIPTGKVISAERLNSVADMIKLGEIIASVPYGKFGMSAGISGRGRSVDVSRTNYANVFFADIAGITPGTTEQVAIVVTKENVAYIIDKAGLLVTTNTTSRAPLIQPVSSLLGWSINSAPMSINEDRRTSMDVMPIGYLGTQPPAPPAPSTPPAPGSPGERFPSENPQVPPAAVAGPTGSDSFSTFAPSR
jgi:hypothetical protein